MKYESNGIFPLDLVRAQNTDKSAVYVSGDASGGTVTIGYKDDFDNFIPLEGGSLTPGEQGLYSHGYGINLFVRILGAGAPLLSIKIAGVN